MNNVNTIIKQFRFNSYKKEIALANTSFLLDSRMNFKSDLEILRPFIKYNEINSFKLFRKAKMTLNTLI